MIMAKNMGMNEMTSIGIKDMTSNNIEVTIKETEGANLILRDIMKSMKILKKIKKKSSKNSKKLNNNSM